MTVTSEAGVHAPAAGRTVLGYFPPGSPDWHAARRNGVGGSEIAAVMGLSPYESRFSLWHRKQELVSPVDENPQMYWGTRLEPAICAEFANRHPEWVVRRAPTYAGPERPWQIVNPDRLLIPACNCGLHRTPCCQPGTGNPADCGPCCPDCPTCPTEDKQPTEVLEAKTARDDHGWGEEGTDEIPVHYRAQCLWYMDALGVARCRVAVLIAGSDYREYAVEYNPAEALMLREAGAEFVRSVRDNVRPNIDGHMATMQVVRELPDGQDDVDVDVSPQLRNRYFAALDAFKSAEWEKREAAALLLDEIGTGRRAKCLGETVATRTVRNGKTYSLQPARTRSAA